METEFRFVEEAPDRYVDRRRKVWLECNEEPHELRAVKVVRIGHVAQDIPILTFVCPRCGKQHQSLVFV
jgi:hypothetical protein